MADGKRRAIPGRTYQLLGSDVLPAVVWTQAGDKVTATDASAEQTFDAGAGAAYLRVQLLEE